MRFDFIHSLIIFWSLIIEQKYYEYFIIIRQRLFIQIIYYSFVIFWQICQTDF